MIDKAKENGAESIKPAFLKRDAQGVPTAVMLPEGGLTKREYFAALALQGICSNRSVTHDARLSVDEIRKDYAESAVAMADHLLLELER